MKFVKTVLILIFFIAQYSNLHANLSVSNKTIFENRDESNTNKHIGAITFITNTMTTNYVMDTNAQSIIIEGDSITTSTGEDFTTFRYVTPITENQTHPFRYTEVSFLITFPFIYTYGILLVAGFDLLDSIFTSSGSAYSQLTTSQLIFTFAAATLGGAAVAYDNYSRVYGNRAKESEFNVSFIPILENVDKKTNAGFLFSFSYPW